MTNRKLIFNLLVDILVFIALIVLISTITSSVNDLITINNALGQMENSNDAYTLMNTYNQIPRLLKMFYWLIIPWFAHIFICDIYNYFINNEKEKN